MAKAAAKRKKTKAKTPKFSDSEQSGRFIETARELGVEETGETFERAFKKIVPHRAEKARTND